MSDTQQCLPLELSAYRSLDPSISLKVNAGSSFTVEQNDISSVSLDNTSIGAALQDYNLRIFDKGAS